MYAVEQPQDYQPYHVTQVGGQPMYVDQVFFRVAPGMFVLYLLYMYFAPSLPCISLIFVCMCVCVCECEQAGIDKI